MIVLTILMMPVICGGCSKDELKKAYDDAKSKTEDLAASTKQSVDSAVSSTVTAIEETLPETGNITVRGSMPIEKTGQASLEVISIGDGRPNVVQILSYDPDQQSMSYPAILIQGKTDQESAQSLSGKSIECDVYLQSTANGPIVMSKPGTHVAVTFDQFSSEEGTISASIAGGEVVSSDMQTATFLGGEMIALVRP
ncbi:hypothetical protein [Rhodopirellula sallentina]|uniref:Uncharacterized protein n=1 Tax=Rhodopirellula sallentina SM41 TaxID=1263870 RepID=M5TZ82_9BACT|nr:hypothetical protein [Rhodopirellula sallentina]EMI54510.1 hypothetical protein RSSM_03981 [Rhodopirellula sallentina SM41]